MALLQALDSSSHVSMCEWLCLGMAHGMCVVYEYLCMIFKSLCVQQSVRCSVGWLSLDPPLGVMIRTLTMDLAECTFL